MPEGDTLHQAAQRLQPLVGQIVTGVSGSHRSTMLYGRRLLGARIESIAARGKHLIISCDNGWAARTHLGMTGMWHRYTGGERWRRSPGTARIVLETADQTAVCFSAPSVEIAPAPVVERRLSRLGPDLLHDVVRWEDVIRRARRSTAATVADLLLDQSVMAGIGNLYKNEVLFLERIDPDTPPSLCRDETIVRLGIRAQRLLVANADSPRRSTTGRKARGAESWVYGRGGRPCRRCGATIAATGIGSGDRLTYRCPSCQVMAPSGPPDASSDSVTVDGRERSESNG